MNVFCCLCEDRHLLLGIPQDLQWSIKAIPCEAGSILTLHIDGSVDIPLLGGNPINLSEQRIEVTDSGTVCTDIIGPVQYLDISQLPNGITYFEAGKYIEDSGYSETLTRHTEHKAQDRDCTMFDKWNKLLAYLEGRFDPLTVSAWLDDTTVTEFTEETLRIKAGNDFRCEVVKRRCLNYIQEALAELFHSNATVEIFVSTV